MIQCKIGSVLICSVCGPEVTVVFYKGVKPSPVCYNKPMENHILSFKNILLFCLWLGGCVNKKTTGKVEPFCCNKPMIFKK
ncbi:hypothetical protein B9J78_01300 [bacterium Unc6]|nr:hypothetical protein [bacterium Unc6]